MITPYNWWINLAEALTPGLDPTVVASTGSGNTLPWARPLLLEQKRDRICLVTSPLNELEEGSRMSRVDILEMVNLTRCFSILRPQNTRCGRES